MTRQVFAQGVVVVLVILGSLLLASCTPTNVSGSEITSTPIEPAETPQPEVTSTGTATSTPTPDVTQTVTPTSTPVYTDPESFIEQNTTLVFSDVRQVVLGEMMEYMCRSFELEAMKLTYSEYDFSECPLRWPYIEMNESVVTEIENHRNPYTGEVYIVTTDSGRMMWSSSFEGYLCFNEGDLAQIIPCEEYAWFVVMRNSRGAPRRMSFESDSGFLGVSDTANLDAFFSETPYDVDIPEGLVVYWGIELMKMQYFDGWWEHTIEGVRVSVEVVSMPLIIQTNFALRRDGFGGIVPKWLITE